MGKGISSIILIIIVIAAVAFLYFFGSGFKLSSTITYKNDIITVEDFSVTAENLFPGGTSTISFFIQNNGDRTARNTVVEFTDLHGMIPTKLECNMEEQDFMNGVKCDFGDLESLDNREVSLTLTAQNVTEKEKFIATYRIAYDYSGYKEAIIPVIDGVTVKKSPVQYKESSMSYGPIAVEFEPPVGGTRIEAGETIKEYWGVKGYPFSMTTKFKNVGSSYGGKITPPVIKVGDLKMKLVGLDLDVPCVDRFIKTADDYYIYKRDLKIPDDSITCNYRPLDFSDPWTIANVILNFSYNFEYFKTQSFVIQPLR